jgi:hypothetical protein
MFGHQLQAETEIDLSKFADLLRFPGLPLETIEYTERESRVRNIDFKKVLYLKVVDRRFDYPAAIYIAPKNSIEKAKYDKVRNLIRTADAELAAQMTKTGFAYLADIDDAVVCFDQIKMSKHIPSRSNEGEDWITSNVGGLSITCSSEELGLDYQIFLFGKLDSDPEILTKYRKDLADPSFEEFLGMIRELVQLVKESPAVSSQAMAGSTRPAKRNAVDPEDPGGVKEGNDRPTDMSTADATEPKPGRTRAYLALWPWIVGLIFIVVIIFVLVQRKQNR